DPSRLEQVKQRFPAIQVSPEPDAALADPAVDAVVIATPSSTHHALGRAALLAGKHVLVEKPMATRAADADELCALAERNGRVLLVGHVFLHNTAVQRVKAYVEDGSLGRVHYVSMVRTNLGPIRTDVDAAWDLAAHDLSVANYWLGAEPTAVNAVGGTWINAGLADAVFLTFRYPDNVLVHVHASWLNPRKDRLVTVVGDRRMLTFDDMAPQEPLRIYDKQVTGQRSQSAAYVDTYATFRAQVRDGDILIPRVGTGEPLRAECEHFLDCIGRGVPPIGGGRAGAAVVRALEAATRSMQNGGREEAVAK
ncbi:MAG TPA: Gfo/Idh/MocA family oxidoreductase, partial [Myxococcales bacterium]|nr:Gfo/Idh/MocA family oxidoreductase [Myxococcales bacterium]